MTIMNAGPPAEVDNWAEDGRILHEIMTLLATPQWLGNPRFSEFMAEPLATALMAAENLYDATYALKTQSSCLLPEEEITNASAHALAAHESAMKSAPRTVRKIAENYQILLTGLNDISRAVGAYWLAQKAHNAGLLPRERETPAPTDAVHTLKLRLDKDSDLQPGFNGLGDAKADDGEADMARYRPVYRWIDGCNGDLLRALDDGAGLQSALAGSPSLEMTLATLSMLLAQVSDTASSYAASFKSAQNGISGIPSDFAAPHNRGGRP